METRDLGQLAYLNRRFHDPDRLAILTVLSKCEQAGFLFLERITGLTGESLLVPLSKLQKGGLIEIEERFEETRSRVRLSDAGRQMIESYWAGKEASPADPRLTAVERRADAVPGPDIADGRATRFGFTVYQGGGRKKWSDR
jgi:DNA-binding PadR family transcriptional regulator